MCLQGCHRSNCKRNSLQLERLSLSRKTHFGHMNIAQIFTASCSSIYGLACCRQCVGVIELTGRDGCPTASMKCWPTEILRSGRSRLSDNVGTHYCLVTTIAGREQTWVLSQIGPKWCLEIPYVITDPRRPCLWAECGGQRTRICHG